MRVGPCFNRWSLQRGEAKQRELVGMTAVAESGVVEVSSYLTVVSSSEGPVAAEDATLETEE